MPSLEDLTVDQLLAHAQTLSGPANIANALVNNPETRTETLKLIKKLNPAISIPELDAAAPIESKLEDIQKQLRERDAQLREHQARAEIEHQRSALKQQYGFTDQDIQEVEKIMMDEKEPIPTYGAAARYYKATKEVAIPTSAEIAPPVYDLPNKDVWGAGMHNQGALNKIAREQAYSALNDIKAGKIAGV